jgi:starch phosphorylase
MLNRSAWKVSVHNPVKMLHYLEKDILVNAAKDEKFLSHYDSVMARFRAEINAGSAQYARPRTFCPAFERRSSGICDDRWRPVQIIFAGKAHPDDDPGKQVLQKIFNTAKDPSFGGRIAFVEGYDEQLAQYLVHGVDVWLNNPLSPFEGCGTSGMKAMLNGIPHLSILDGWWIEGYNGKNGWAFGGKDEGDAKDAEAIYDILEKEVVPLFYKTGDDGIPRGWVRMMKEAMISVAPLFSARRMVKEYVTKFYQDALKSAI